MTIESLQKSLEEAPYQRFLGVRALSIDPDAGTVTLTVPFRHELCRSSERPEIHGGVTAALIDIAGDYAIVAKIGGPGIPTIDLRIDYLRMAVDTALTAKAEAVKVGRTLGVVNVEVLDDGGRIVAIGRGTYFVKR